MRRGSKGSRRRLRTRWSETCDMHRCFRPSMSTRRCCPHPRTLDPTHRSSASPRFALRRLERMIRSSSAARRDSDVSLSLVSRSYGKHPTSELTGGDYIQPQLNQSNLRIHDPRCGSTTCYAAPVDHFLFISATLTLISCNE